MMSFTSVGAIWGFSRDLSNVTKANLGSANTVLKMVEMRAQCCVLSSFAFRAIPTGFGHLDRLAICYSIPEA
jgi:hypothetical protein